jgi:putative glutamine amidotransferase
MGRRQMTGEGRPRVLVSAGGDWLHDYWMQTLTPPLSAAGADVRALPTLASEDERRRTLRAAHGLVLGGGHDIAPEHYGAELSPLLGPLDPERDALELPLTREALELDLPVLGICRGMQVMSVCLGGTMYRDASEHPGAEDHPSGQSRGFLPVIKAQLAGDPLPPLLTHPASTRPGSLTAEILGEAPSVNSYHHQHLRDLPAEMVASAWAADGVVEAVELPRARFAIGVQWELQVSWSQGAEAGLIERFVDAARRRRSAVDRDLTFKL